MDFPWYWSARQIAVSAEDSDITRQRGRQAATSPIRWGTYPHLFLENVLKSRQENADGLRRCGDEAVETRLWRRACGDEPVERLPRGLPQGFRRLLGLEAELARALLALFPAVILVSLALDTT